MRPATPIPGTRNAGRLPIRTTLNYHTKGCVPADNVTTTGSTVLGNFETTFAALAHILHSIAIDENQPKITEALIDSLSASWEKMKEDYNIDL